MGAGWILDVLLAVALPGVALVAVLARDLRRASVVLVSMGLLAALAWIRLDAPDIALAEAAIGAGLTGVLFLAAAGRIRPAPRRPRRGVAGAAARATALGLAAAAAAAAAVVGAVLSLPADADGLAPAVAQAIPAAAASHPVTAVLLDFRSWDTFLEIAVLLVALLGVWAVGATERERAARAEPVLAATVRLLVPVIILVSGLLLWTGAKAPGGAFQAGVVLGGGGILLALAGIRRPWTARPGLVRAGLGLGPGLFVVAGGAALLSGRALLEYPATGAGAMLVGIEAALTVSIALVVDALFDGRPRLGSGPEAR